MKKDNFRSRFVRALRDLAVQGPRLTTPDRGIYGASQVDWVNDPIYDRRAVPMSQARALLRDMCQAEGKKLRLQADGLPPCLDVCMMLKGMHSGGRDRQGDIFVYLDGLDFYLETGRDPYMNWGPGKRWR